MPSSLIPAPRSLSLADEPGLVTRACRRLLLGQLERLEDAQITLLDRGERRVFGRAESADAPRCTITVRHPRFYRDAVVGGHLAAGEGYVHGLWDCDDLTALVRVFARNLALSDEMDRLPGERRIAREEGVARRGSGGEEKRQPEREGE